MNKKIEAKWQKKWAEKRIFEPESGKGKKFYITVAFPYPSGGVHVGHIRTYTVPDVIARFKRAQGYNVLFPMAWHVTGTPIIGAVKRLKRKEKKQMYVLKKVYKVSDADLKKMTTPIGFANYFINDFKSAFNSLGYGIDWRREFTTNDPHYNKFISWQHSILYKNGLEKKGEHPVKWCLKEKNPVTTHDLLEGEEADMQEFSLLKFKFNSSYIVAATMRPETVFGQTNMWVNPKVTYKKARVGRETWIISQEAVDKLRYQKKRIKVLGSIKGKDIIGKFCLAPGINKKIVILPADFCDPDVGTGLVTSVPSDAPYDWIALQELQRSEKRCRKYGLDFEEVKAIKPIPIIKTREFGEMAAIEICKKMGIKGLNQRERLEEATKIVYREGFHRGVMLAGPYKGVKVERAKDLVKKMLERQGKADSMFDFPEPVICRCGGKVIVAKTKSWFIDYSNENWKALAKKCLKAMKTVPPGTMADYSHAINWLKEWPCVRNFGLGTHLPQDKKFIIEPLSDSTIYMAYYLIAHEIKNYKPSQLKPEFFDFVILGKGNATKVEKATGIPKKDLKELLDSVRYWYPLDWRTSANDLIQNHLTFMVFHHTAIFPPNMWPKGIAVYGMGLLEGGKMSSSKGNVVLAGDAIKEYGADAVRFFLMSSVEPWQDFDWRAKEVKQYSERLSKLYRRITDLWEQAEEGEGGKDLIDRWLLSEFQKIVLETTKSLEGFQTRKASLELFKTNELIKWYIKRAGPGPVLRDVLRDWVVLLMPFVPHLCEEIWKKMGNRGFVSLAKWPKPNKKLIDERLGKMENLVKQTLNDSLEIIKITKARPKKVNIYTAPGWKHAVYKSILESTSKNVIADVMANREIRKYGKEALRLAQSLSKEKGKLKEILTEREEYQALKSAEDFFKKELSCDVRVLEAYKFRTEKALRAEPGKPGIELVI